MKRRLTIGLGCAILAFSGMTLAQNVSVTISNGALLGLQTAGVDAFKGIPFAQPPVGALRWQPPQPAQDWQGARPTVNYGNDCLQNLSPNVDTPADQPGFGEDCLTINVWRPSHSDGKPLPVMMWVYGGGYVNGGASADMYDGAKFARDGVVFVSFNYRLGRFGFFAHPALANDPLRGNYGLMDQIAALKWVQKNIAAFGGDANKVTLFGESAGGFSIVSLLTTPLAQGLFQQAIIQSGSGRHNLAPAPNYQQAEQTGLAFARREGVSGQGDDALKALRDLPASAVVKGLHIENMQADKTYSGPIVDGIIIIDDPQVRFTQGKFAKIPLIVGATDADIGFAPDVGDMHQALASLGKVDFTQARALWDPQGNLTPQQVANTIASDRFMVEPARFMAQEISGQNVPVWQYRFGYVAQFIPDKGAGASHATDVPYVFDALEDYYYGKEISSNDRAVAKLLHQYWVNFAKTGNPNGPGLPSWQAYQRQKDNVLMLPKAGALETQEIRDPWGARLDLISKTQ